MKAIGYHQNLPVDQPNALEDLELPAPAPGPRDLLVRVQAVSVNPVDTKVRRNTAPPAGTAKVLGWDAVGVVEGLGANVTGFEVGDRVFYAGSITRPGANSELHVVDERIAALAPKSLEDGQAAALPLTAITAWELLFDRLRVPHGGGAGQALMIVGGAGGVGSILIQLARQLTQLKVIATASRPETQAWCLELGAHAVIDHSQPLAQALKDGGRVEMWRGGGRSEHRCCRPFRLAVPYEPDPGSVSTPRSSNRTCRSPASGSRTRLTPSPTAGCCQLRSGVRAGSARKGARVDKSRPCLACPDAGPAATGAPAERCSGRACAKPGCPSLR